MIPAMQNATDAPHGGVAARIVAQTTARRTNYASEVRALLDAALEVIAKNGTAAKARVADIVAIAGLSNDAFYRHFSSKDALVSALVEDGAERVAAAVGRQMAKESDPDAQVRCWLAEILSQADEAHAAPTMAVLANSTNLNITLATGNSAARGPLARLLCEPFSAAGCHFPEFYADLVTDAVLAQLSRHMWEGTRPTEEEVSALLGFCLAAATT